MTRDGYNWIFRIALGLLISPCIIRIIKQATIMESVRNIQILTGYVIVGFLTALKELRS